MKKCYDTERNIKQIDKDIMKHLFSEYYTLEKKMFQVTRILEHTVTGSNTNIWEGYTCTYSPNIF